MSDQAIVTTSSSDRSDLSAWLDDQKRQKVTRVVLRLRTETGVEQVVRELRLDGEDKPQSHEIADGLMSRARNSARMVRGRAMFSVCGLGAGNETVDSFGFSVTSDEPRHVENNPSNELLALLMRHTEVSARMSIGCTSDLINKWRDLVEVKDAENAALRAEIARMAEDASELAAARSERELMLIQARQNDRRDAKLWEKFDLLLPVALRYLAPSAAQPKSGVFLEDLVEKIVSSLTEEQMERIAVILSVEQRIALIQLVQAYNERGAKRQQAEDQKASANDAQPSGETSAPSEANDAAA
jgi:hypothetical protein